MTTEFRSSNDDKSRVIRDSLHRYIGFTVQPFYDLTRRSHSRSPGMPSPRERANALSFLLQFKCP